MPKAWRVGIVGAGYIAGAHLLALKSVVGARVVAICDTDEIRAEQLAQRWGIGGVAGSVTELLAKYDVDAVHIITPPTAHLEPALACLEARRHVFIEKPLCPSSVDCRRIEDTARSAGVQAGVNHNQSWHPAVLKVVEAARQRRFGRLEHVSVCLSTGLRQLSAGQHGHWMFREPINILLEQAPHPLSQIVRLMGSIREVSCLATGRRTLKTGKDFWDTWLVGMVCERGSAQLTLAFGRDHLDSWLQVTGQDASAHADLGRNTMTFHPKRRWTPPLADCMDALSSSTGLAMQGLTELAGYAAGFLRLADSRDTFSTGMRSSICAFYAALSEGRPVPVPAREGREIVEACERIYASMLKNTGRGEVGADA